MVLKSNPDGVVGSWTIKLLIELGGALPPIDIRLAVPLDSRHVSHDELVLILRESDLRVDGDEKEIP